MNYFLLFHYIVLIYRPTFCCNIMTATYNGYIGRLRYQIKSQDFTLPLSVNLHLHRVHQCTFSF